MLPWWNDFVVNTELIKLAIEKKDPNENLRRQMENYLERLLPTLYIIRHGLNKDFNEIIDNSESMLSHKHHQKMKLLKAVKK